MLIGIDIGGTFTDIVCLNQDGEVTTRKVSSTSDDYSRSIREALPEIFTSCQSEAADVEEIIHGTTVATNAILEQAGARTALITTRGFRDVLELRRIRMPELYNWQWDKPPDLVDRRLRFEVTERLDAAGNVVTALDEEDARRVIARVLESGVESIGICLINSYVNPVHEQRLRELIREKDASVSVSISTDILREAKEYERTATLVVSAYVRPTVVKYVEKLTRALEEIGVRAPLLIMQSNGGVMTAEAATTKSVFMIESGPAAGVIGAHALAKTEGLANAITFDMGGTTAKASIIEEGQVSTASEYEVGSSISLVSRLIKGGGHLIRVPAIDLAEVGAGGGSIAWLDSGKALQVGPRSAGAMPGPVCYGRGGTQATITDANLLLGYINPEGLAGGGIVLDRKKAEKAVSDQVAGPLGMDLMEAALGIHVLANASMMRAVRAVSTQRGRDVRGFSLIAFGGSGPIHACEMARSLEMRHVVIPPHPGLFSAFGLLAADIVHQQVRTYYKHTRQVDLDDLNATFEKMESDLRGLLVREGFPKEQVQTERSADLRYRGQSYELIIPVPPGRLDWSRIGHLEEAFAREHERTYGHRGGVEEEFSLVNLRVAGKVSRPIVTPQAPRNGYNPLRENRLAYFGKRHGTVTTPVISRSKLKGESIAGPLLIDEYDSTIVAPPRSRVRLDGHGNVHVDLEV